MVLYDSLVVTNVRACPLGLCGMQHIVGSREYDSLVGSMALYIAMSCFT